MGRSRARTTLPDLFAASDHRAWLAEVVEARRQARPERTVSSVARAAKVPASRLRAAIQADGSLSAEEVQALATHLKLSLEATRFFGLLVAFGQADRTTERRRALDGLVAILGERAERQGQGPRFRAHSRWEHRVVHSGLRRGALRPEVSEIASRTGIPEAVAARVLADLEVLGPEFELSETVSCGPDADLPTRLLTDDLIVLGLRSLARWPERTGNQFFHWALPERAALHHAEDLGSVHRSSGGERRPEARRLPVLIMTHSVSVTKPLES